MRSLNQILESEGKAHLARANETSRQLEKWQEVFQTTNPQVARQQYFLAEDRPHNKKLRRIGGDLIWGVKMCGDVWHEAPYRAAM